MHHATNTVRASLNRTIMHAGTKSDLKHVDQTNYPPSPALSVSGAMVSEAEPDFGGQASGTVLLLRFLQDVGALLGDETDAHTRCWTQPRTNSTSTSAASGCAMLSIERTPSICRQIYDAPRAARFAKHSPDQATSSQITCDVE